MRFLQNIINHLYRYPKSKLARYKRFGGYRLYKKMLSGELAMQQAAETLPPIASASGGYPVYFLTGKKYLHQTLFCIHSLIKVTNTPFQFYLVDDGTIDANLKARLNKQLPGATLINQADITANLNDVIPADVYPNLRAKRQVYPHLRKLTDIHTISMPDWKLVLDSDMLFWKTPIEIIQWLVTPQQPIHMVDCAENYGYSKVLMVKLTGEVIPPKLNVGVIGLNSNAINWPDLEKWIGILEAEEGASYYLEQALSAMLIGSQPATVLDAAAYVVNPSAGDDRCVLKHYVDLSKKEYFSQAWRLIH